MRSRDYYGGLCTIAAEWLGVPVDTFDPEVSYGLPEWKVPQAPGGYKPLYRFAVTQRDLFRNLQPMPHVPQVLRALSGEGIQIRVITHRLFIGRFHQTAVAEDGLLA